jgi:flagellar biosynthesis component FlhA
VVIERVAEQPAVPPGRWRNHAVVALVVAVVAIVMVGIPVVSLSLAWALLTMAATISIVVNVTTMATDATD